MREIGGYFEFENFHGDMLHDSGIKLDCGRSCLAYLIEAKSIRRLAIPEFMCNAVFDLCNKYEVELFFYEVGYDFKPKEIDVEEDQYLLLVNYYGQLTEEDIIAYKKDYGRRVILDNTQAYFMDPVDGVDTFYTCRKYFGVPDGGVLYTDVELSEIPPQSESYNQMLYLLGRYEKTAAEFYELSSINNDRFDGQPIRRMSKLTENLLKGIDYEFIRTRRESNYRYLDSKLHNMNRLKVISPDGPFAYPLLLEKRTDEIRAALASEGIYIPVLWPNVAREYDADSVAYDLSMNILPIPCDQRYSLEDMDYLLDMLTSVV